MRTLGRPTHLTVYRGVPESKPCGLFVEMYPSKKRVYGLGSEDQIVLCMYQQVQRLFFPNVFPAFYVLKSGGRD